MINNPKAVLKWLLTRSCALRAMSKLSSPRIVIFRYHSVQENPRDYEHSIGNGIIHSSATFERQMAIISREYHPVTLNDLTSFLSGEKSLPRRSVAITFDDGYVDNYKFALPILEKFGLRASFYITVSSVGSNSAPWFCRLNRAFSAFAGDAFYSSKDGKAYNLSNPIQKKKAFTDAATRCACLSGNEQSDALAEIENELGFKSEQQENKLMMNWGQIRELRRLGHITGSHTLTHPNLAYLEMAAVQKEMAESKRILEKKLGEPTIHFSYPGPILEPHYSKDTIRLSQQIGYKTAVTSTCGAVRKMDNPLALKRIPVPKEELEFRWYLDNAFLGREL